MELEILKDLGLKEKEAVIYIALLKEKIASASKLAKITKINRTTVYLELDNLIRLGLANYINKNSKRLYQPSDPDKLIDILDTKKAKVNSILPKLKAFSKTIDPFKIETYEGKNGLKTLYQDIMKNANEVQAFGVTGQAYKILKFEFPHLIKKYIKKGISARYLANSDSKELLKQLSKKNVKIKYLPKKYSYDVTNIIYKDK